MADGLKHTQGVSENQGLEVTLVSRKVWIIKKGENTPHDKSLPYTEVAQSYVLPLKGDISKPQVVEKGSEFPFALVFNCSKDFEGTYEQ